MTRFTVRHNQSIWETTTFEVEVTEPLPAGYESPVDYIRDNLDLLMAAALDADEATVEQGDHVGSIDSDIEIHDEAGNKVYAELEDGEDG